jgi:2-dehydropantoate 2-reductase
MRICIYGTGAIGGHVATRLAATSTHEVSVVARGAVLKAIREHGLVLHSGGKEIRGRPHAATDDPSSLPLQDLVIVGLKAPALPDAAATIGRLLAPEGCALFTTNGIPWWWHYGTSEPRPLPLLDPQGTLWMEVGPQRALACIVYSANAMDTPGVIHHSGNDRWLCGEPDGSNSPRLQQAIAALRGAGLNAEAAPDLRREIWRKLPTNASGNCVSALTRLNFHALGAHAETRELMAAIMRETMAVGAALGYDLRGEIDVERDSRRANTDPHQRPHSMLWDALTHRPMEVEAMLGQTQAFARDAGIAVPTTDVVVALLRALDRAGRTAPK